MDQRKTGRFIAERRRELNLTQKDLADKLGITDRAVSKWENGRCMPDLSLLQPLSRILKVGVNDLLSGDISAYLLLQHFSLFLQIPDDTGTHVSDHYICRDIWDRCQPYCIYRENVVT